MGNQISMNRFDSRKSRSTESDLKIWESPTPKSIQEFLPRRLHKATTSIRPSSYSPRPASGRGVGGEGYSIAAIGQQDHNAIQPPHPQPFSPAKPGAKGARQLTKPDPFNPTPTCKLQATVFRTNKMSLLETSLLYAKGSS